MKILAISDCHYKFHQTCSADKQNAELLVSFLKSCVSKYDAVALVGDIFDLWFDGKYTMVKQYFPLLRALADIHDAGARLLYISGNHDFWFGNFLPQYLGCEIYPDGVTLKADGKSIRFEHGDTRTINDLRYQIYRKLIRLKPVKQLFGLLHPDFALSLGTLLSRSSRTRQEKPALRKAKTAGLKHYATKLITSKKADIVVMGHSHIPTLEQIEAGYYINCGDWINHFTYVEIDAGNPTLKQYYNHKIELQEKA